MTQVVAERTKPEEKKAKGSNKQYRFKIADGRHVEQYETGEVQEILDDTGAPTGRRHKMVKTKIYFQGDEIETDEDLHARYDQQGLPPKFVPVEGPATVEGIDAEIARLQATRERMLGGPEQREGEPVIREGGVGSLSESVISTVPGLDTLNAMDEAELRKTAKEAEVDLRGAKDRKEITKRILASRGIEV